MMHVLHELVLMCVLLFLTMACSQQTARESQKHRDVTPSRRQRRTVEGNSLAHLVNAMQRNDMSNTELYMHFTPSTPTPDNINCYVEVPTLIICTSADGSVIFRSYTRSEEVVVASNWGHFHEDAARGEDHGHVKPASIWPSPRSVRV